QLLKASLERQEFDLKRDFVEYPDGGPPEPAPETNPNMVIAASSDGWKFLPYRRVEHAGARWRRLNFDDTNWPPGKAPLGYGEAELDARSGTQIGEEGRPFAFRRVFDMPRELLQQPGAFGRVKIASDNSAVVFLNGEPVDEEPEEDHEFSYWNREFDLPLDRFRPGRNIFAVVVRNTPGSSDLYFDLELSVETPIEPAQ
ncbi:MAG TPA: hypothetical protein VHB77_04265, partial [Planctomycetaceae bacterium]|nr:hypothetical protein [Planctomycetaceae bacterium]